MITCIYGFSFLRAETPCSSVNQQKTNATHTTFRHCCERFHVFSMWRILYQSFLIYIIDIHTVFFVAIHFSLLYTVVFDIYIIPALHICRWVLIYCGIFEV